MSLADGLFMTMYLTTSERDSCCLKEENIWLRKWREKGLRNEDKEKLINSERDRDNRGRGR